jgi:hypothetical protein
MKTKAIGILIILLLSFILVNCSTYINFADIDGEEYIFKSRTFKLDTVIQKGDTIYYTLIKMK